MTTLAYNPYTATSDANTFNALVYGNHHPGTMAYLQRQMKRIPDRAIDVASDFYDRARQIYESFHGMAAQVHQAQVRAQFTGNVVSENVSVLHFVPLSDLGALQMAAPHLARFVMADPHIRQHWVDQRIQGYPEIYTYDQTQGTVEFGEDHYDWRLLNSGIIQEESGPGYSAGLTFYHDDLSPGDRELTGLEKIHLHMSNSLARLALDCGYDPTDVAGGMVRD